MTTVIRGTDDSASTPALTGTDADTGIFFPAANTMAMSTGGSERVRVDSDGDVGIGTTSPDSKLHVAGSFRQTGATAPFEWTVNSGGADFLKLNAVGYADNLFVANSVGNVGIGTNSPSERLQVAGSIRVTSNASNFNVLGGQFDFATNATRISAYNSTGGIIELFTNLSGGNVAVRAFIDVNGNFAIPTSYNHTTASAANTFMRSDGYLMRSTSALKYKQDIRDLESIDISLLRPVRYKSKCEGDDQTKDHLGIVANEAHEAGFTDLVTYGAEGEVEGFQYERLTVVLLKAIQEQQTMIQELTAKVAALEAKG
jgi:hypothetical protein